MRAWIIESLPDYEPSTRLGTFASPHAAWQTLLERVEYHVFNGSSFRIEVVQPKDPGERDVVLDFVYHSNDRIRLVGVYITGTGSTKLTSREQREFQEVAALASQHARQKEAFTRTETLLWDVRRTEDFTAVWTFVKNDD